MSSLTGYMTHFYDAVGNMVGFKDSDSSYVVLQNRSFIGDVFDNKRAYAGTIESGGKFVPASAFSDGLEGVAVGILAAVILTFITGCVFTISFFVYHAIKGVFTKHFLRALICLPILGIVTVAYLVFDQLIGTYFLFTLIVWFLGLDIAFAYIINRVIEELAYKANIKFWFIFRIWIGLIISGFLLYIPLEIFRIVLSTIFKVKI